MSFQAINNFLLNQNNVDFQNNILDLQSNDLTNLKFSDNSLSNLSKSQSFSEVLSSYSSNDYSVKNEPSAAVTDHSEVNTPKESVKSESKVEQSDNNQTEKTYEEKKVESKDSKQTKVEKENKKDESKNEVADSNLMNFSKDQIITEDSSKKLKISSKDFSKIEELGEVSNNIQSNNIEIEDFDELQLLSKNDVKVKANLDNNQKSTELILPEELKDLKNLESGEKSFENSNFSFENHNEKKSKNESNSKITLKDLRTEISEELNLSENSEVKVTDVKVENNHPSVTMELVQNAQNVQNNVLSLDSQTASSNGSNFQTMLNNQIQANIPEFVKTGSIILKDNNQGNINLILNPEELGNVKINLALDGKSISGQITVVSKEALEVFKDNAETLREAFIKSGFENASIDISFAGNGNFENETQNFEEFTKEHQRIAANRSYGSAVAVESDLDSEKNDIFGNNSVNIVA